MHLGRGVNVSVSEGIGSCECIASAAVNLSSLPLCSARAKGEHGTYIVVSEFRKWVGSRPMLYGTLQTEQASMGYAFLRAYLAQDLKA
jgi:hypothetical protein